MAMKPTYICALNQSFEIHECLDRCNEQNKTTAVVNTITAVACYRRQLQFQWIFHLNNKIFICIKTEHHGLNHSFTIITSPGFI